MTDIATISAILGSLKSATEIAKFISNSGVSLEKAEVKLKFAELVGALADTKLEIAEIQSLLLDKNEEITKLQQKLELTGSVIYENRFYWKQTDAGKDGPFCQRCYDVESKLVRLQEKQTTYDDRISTWFACTACKTNYDA